MTALVNTETGEILGDASPTPYQLLPRLTDDEYDALRDDIARHGIRVPIDVDERGTIIDGHHRAWIAADLHIDCPRRVLSGLTDEDKRAHAVAVNIHRRNLTRDQRRDLVRRLREQGMSTRRIADAAQVPARTVANDLAAVPPVPTGTGHTAPAVIGADGKTYAPQTLEQRRDLATELRARGMSIAEVAAAMGVAKSTAQTLLAARRKPDVLTKSPADTPKKVERIRELAATGHTSGQIADDLDLSDEWVRQLARDHGIDINADRLVSRTASNRRIDSDRIARETVMALDALTTTLRLINYDDIDPDEAREWTASLTESMRVLNRFAKQIKETVQ